MEYMAQPGASGGPCGGLKERKTEPKTQSDQAGLTQANKANRPPRNPVRFTSIVGEGHGTVDLEQLDAEVPAPQEYHQRGIASTNLRDSSSKPNIRAYQTTDVSMSATLRPTWCTRQGNGGVVWLTSDTRRGRSLDGEGSVTCGAPLRSRP
jgi:hypothetical protein